MHEFHCITSHHRTRGTHSVITKISWKEFLFEKPIFTSASFPFPSKEPVTLLWREKMKEKENRYLFIFFYYTFYYLQTNRSRNLFLNNLWTKQSYKKKNEGLTGSKVENPFTTKLLFFWGIWVPKKYLSWVYIYYYWITVRFWEGLFACGNCGVSCHEKMYIMHFDGVFNVPSCQTKEDDNGRKDNMIG